jgi:D-beta-D-heptose 7-phosphate kinase/D-beta-D-heptose 1-phosphate adenosyltransferase
MTANLIELVEHLGSPHLVVLGDLILDRYVWGHTERVSPEAPVLVLRADHREERLGGAASVAVLLAGLGAKVTLAGVLGADAEGRRCRELLQAAGIDHELVLDDPARTTTLKERYLGRAQQKHPQQMLRVDYEAETSVPEALLDQLAAGLRRRVADAAILLISDYQKGVCQPRLLQALIRAAREAGRRVLVDPCRSPVYDTLYIGCSALTPNRLEAGLATGLTVHDVATAYQAAAQLQRRLATEVGIVTLDRDGIVMVDQDKKHRHFPVRERQVYDITGAGDTVLAVLGLVLAAGHGYPEALTLANVAAGLQVERTGVTTVTRADIIKDLFAQHPRLREKLVNRATLAREVACARLASRTVVFTNGCFDLLHAGHIHYLREARCQGEVLVVGLNSDASVHRLGKGPGRPVHDQGCRAQVLAGLECVDYICFFDEPTPLELIELVRPDVLVKGADYRPEQVVGRAFVESYGGRLHLAAFLPGHSTTATVTRLEEHGRRSGPGTPP